MAKITVEVKGVNTGGGNNNQNQNNPPQQPPQPSSPQPPTQHPQPAAPAQPTPTLSQPQQTTGTQQPTAPAQPTPPNVSSKPYQRKSDEDDSRTTNKPNYQRSTDDGSGQSAASPTPSGKPYQRSVDNTQIGQQTVPQTAQTPHPGAATQAANQFSGNQPGFTVETGDGNGGTRTIFNQPGQDTGTKTQDDTLPDDDEVVNPNQPPVSSPPIQPTPPTQPSQPALPTQQPNQPSQPTQPTPPTQPNNQPNQPTPPNRPTPPLPPKQPYQRIDLNQYVPQRLQNPSMPPSDRMVEDIRREIAQRGVLLVPGTSNFSTMMNTLQQNQRNAINANILSKYDQNIESVEDAREKAHADVVDSIHNALQGALFGITDAKQIQKIKDKYAKIEEGEHDRVDAAFDPIVQRLQNDRAQAENESEDNLTRAIEALTAEIKQGNPDSYLNRLKDDYKTAIYKRDNAMTEADAIEASKEAAKIQERMARAQGAPDPRMMRLAGGAVTAAGLLGNAAFQSAQISDRMQWGLGLEQASSILNGNAFQAIRQRNAYESQQASTWWGAGAGAVGALGGAAIGSMFGGIGAVPGYIIGGLIGALAGGVGGQVGAYYLGGNRERVREDYRAQASELWRAEEQRISQFNDLAMLTRGNNGYVGGVRNWYINQSQDPLMRAVVGDYGFGNETAPAVNAAGAFNPNNQGLDLYDLGYTSPEFAQQAARRIKQRGMVRGDSIENALYADALERIFSLSSGALGTLSQYDRFGKNNANQDFADLAGTLDRLGTTGMRQGAWARSDEFLGYMTQLGQSQRSTFLTVDNARSARQVATGQAMFGDKFGAEAMRGIEAVNNQVQNPGGGYAKTMLYDVIQELYPDTRGDIRKIREAQYDPSKQNAIQKAFAKRVQEMYGGADTTSGFLAFEEIYGINNPNVLNPIVKQMTEGGGLEATRLSKANQEELVKPISQGDYTPQVTKELNKTADAQMAELLNYERDLVQISQDLLKIIRQDIKETLKEAVNKLGSGL